MMKTSTVHKQAMLPASQSMAWQLLANQQGLAQWLGDNVALQPQTGGQYLQQTEHNGRPYTLRGRVLSYLPPRELMISLRIDNNDEGRWPVYTVVSLRLQTLDGDTWLDVLHRGFENLPEQYRSQAYGEFEQYWTLALERLQAALAVHG